jgi:stage II sporulation protein D
MDVDSRFWVKVLMLNNVTTCTLTSPSMAFAALRAEERQWGSTESGRHMEVRISGGKININGRPYTSKEITISADKPHIFNLNGNHYRGKLKLMLNSDGKSFDAVNLVPLEAYLAGVVGAEMPDYWEPAALEAQAITARTYCLYIKKHHGSKRSWDVKPTAANQVYLGVKAESRQIWKAIDKTYGQVLVTRHPDGREDIFPSYYSSVCGGHTENSKNVFGDSYEALSGVACTYCRNVAKPGFFFWPMIKFDKSKTTKKLLQKYPKLKELGEITKIAVTRQSNYENFSRLTSIKLFGSKGKSGFLRAEDLRLTIDPTGNKLRSTIFKIVSMDDKWGFLSGRGYGHGVGMCQCGAQGMARLGNDAGQILSHYYPGSRIKNIYQYD